MSYENRTTSQKKLNCHIQIFLHSKEWRISNNHIACIAYIGVYGGSCLYPDPPSVLLLLEAVEENVVEELVEQLLQALVVCTMRMAYKLGSEYCSDGLASTVNESFLSKTLSS